MKLSECKGKSFLLNGKIINYQALLKLIYEGNQFGPVSLANIDQSYANELSAVKNQMGADSADKSLNLLKTEIIEIDITKEDIKPVNPTKTMFVVEKCDPLSIKLSNCLSDDFMFTCDGEQVELSFILGLIYNKKPDETLPEIQAIQLDTMYDHDMSMAMQALYMGDNIDNNYELSMLKTKTVILDIAPEKIEKVQGYEDVYVLKQKTKKPNAPKTTVVKEATPEEKPEVVPQPTPVPAPAPVLTPIEKASERPIEQPIEQPIPKPVEYTTPTSNSTTLKNNNIDTPPTSPHYNYEERTPQEDVDLFGPFASRRNKEAVASNIQNNGSGGATVETWKRAAVDAERDITEEEKESILQKRKKDKYTAKIINIVKTLLGWAINIAIFIGIIYLISNFFIFNASIPSNSMDPTMTAGDKIIGNRLAYKFGRPERGDVAIFKNPDNNKEYYIKRIIGLPGEVVTIKEGKIYIGDSETPLNEPYITEEWTVENDGYTFVVPEDSYLMLGDNRNNSYDARYWNNTYVHKDDLIAEAIMRYFPLNEISEINKDQEDYYKEVNDSAIE